MPNVRTESFWVDSPILLFTDLNFVPLPSMTFVERFNSISRLVVILTLLILPFSNIISLFILIIGLAILIFLFPKLDKKENFITKETYIPKRNMRNKKGANFVEYYQPQCVKDTQQCVTNASNPCRLPALYEQLDYNKNFVSLNQRLVGGPAKRTMVPPVLVPPLVSSEWRESDLVIRSGINTQTNDDLASSGYYVTPDAKECTDECGQIACCGKDIAKELIESNYTPIEDVVDDLDTPVIEGYQPPPKIRKQTKSCPEPIPSYPSTYHYPYQQQNKKVEVTISPDEYSGEVLRADGYFPDQILNNNLPSNVAFGECEKAAEFNEYNNQTFTSSLQPGVYTRNEIIEPISSNIGISFTQQFEPVTCKKGHNSVTFIGHDPNLIEQPANNKQLLPYDREVHLADIYDPRFTGYGTSYRSYIEPVTGQPRFYYDDVDSYKRPNYISKSDVDFLPTSIATQAIPDSNYFNRQNKFSRTLAQEAFTDNTLTFRTEMQERLMRKANANLEQKRRFPKHTNDFNRGGMRGRRN